MDEAVIRYYRGLLKAGFRHAGSLEEPSIFLDYDATEGVLCGKTGDSLHLYINIHSGVVNEVKYLCTCDPTANVVIEVLCDLIENKPLPRAMTLKETDFTRAIGSDSEQVLKKARAIIELLKQGVSNHTVSPSASKN